MAPLALIITVVGSVGQVASAQTPADTQTIQQLARAAASKPQASAELQQSGHSSGVQAWLQRNSAALVNVRPGPFEPRPQYVTTYSGNKIYVHILDWEGKNNIILPAILDRPIDKAWLLETGKEVRVDQAPWGLLLVVPEEQRPNAANTVVVLEVPGEVNELRQPRIVEAEPQNPFILLGDAAKITGKINYNRGPDWLEGWGSTNESVEWRVKAPMSGDYTVYLTYACAPGCAGAIMQVVANGNSKVTAATRETKGVWKGWQAFERIAVPAKLRLRRGVNAITVRALRKAGTEEIIRLRSVELVSRVAEEAARMAADRARAVRSDASWLADAKYGLMVHWLPNATPQAGPPKPYCEAVKDLDVERLAQLTQDAGAGYFIFSLAQRQFFPMPLQTADAILPGRTCNERDLVRDLADAFTRRNIRFLLYYHHGVGDPEWSRAAGFFAPDKTRFFANEAAVLSEIGSRYGDKLAGWWFDDRYPYQPFEQLFHASKIGNDKRIVAFNSWVMPKSTEFQDYWAGEMGGELEFLPNTGFFDAGGPAAGLQPHALIFVDDPWLHGEMNKKIKDPLFPNDRLIRFIQDTNAKRGAVTMNIGVYQDGTASPATLQQLRAIRRAIRGR